MDAQGGLVVRLTAHPVATPTANGEERPTSAQWAKIAAVGAAIGWQDGLEDERLRSFVKRTAKVSSTKFLEPHKASKVIMGLENWAAQMHDNQQAGPIATCF